MLGGNYTIQRQPLRVTLVKVNGTPKRKERLSSVLAWLPKAIALSGIRQISWNVGMILLGGIFLCSSRRFSNALGVRVRAIATQLVLSSSALEK